MIKHSDPEDRIRDLETIVVRLDMRQSNLEQDTLEIKEVLKDVRDLLTAMVRVQANIERQDSKIFEIQSYNLNRKIETDTFINEGKDFMSKVKTLARVGLMLVTLIQSVVVYYVNSVQNDVAALNAKDALILEKIQTINLLEEKILNLREKVDKAH